MQHGIKIRKRNSCELQKTLQPVPFSGSLQKAIQSSKKNMERAAKEMEFMDAAKYRDEMFALEKMMQEKFGK